MWKRPAYRGADCGSARPGGAGQPELDAPRRRCRSGPSAADRPGRAAAAPGISNRSRGRSTRRRRRQARAADAPFSGVVLVVRRGDDGGALVGQRTPRIRLVRVAHADYGARCRKSKAAQQPPDVGVVHRRRRVRGDDERAGARAHGLRAMLWRALRRRKRRIRRSAAARRAIFRRQGCAISLCGSRGPASDRTHALQLRRVFQLRRRHLCAHRVFQLLRSPASSPTPPFHSP